MKHTGKPALLVAFLFCLSIIMVQAFTLPKDDDDGKPENLKVLPKNISHDDLMKNMKMYSKSLGVKCGHCHAGSHPDMDFASDAKPEKNIARKMIKMTDAINKKYLGKIGDGKLEQISCVTCHRGRTTPIISVDSLTKN